MKNNLLPSAFFRFAFICCIGLISLTTLRGEESYQVTASDYCFFLNQRATTDTEHLYDGKMTLDPLVASIAREGTPGEYRYYVIANCEKEPISFINKKIQVAYCEWLDTQQNKSAIEKQQSAVFEIDELKSNKSHLEIVPEPCLMLSAAPLASFSFFSLDNFNNVEKAAAVVGAIGLVTLCPELMMRRGSESPPPSTAEGSTLSIEGFNTVIESPPTALELKSKAREESGSDSEHSSNSSQGKTTHERTSQESRTSSHSLKKVSFSEEIVANDELKKEDQLHSSFIQNPSVYLTRAAIARKEGRQEESIYWDKVFNYAQKYNQYQPYFQAAVEGEKNQLTTEASVALWRNVLNHAKECIDHYVEEAQKTLTKRTSSPSPLKGKGFSLKAALDHHINAAKYKMEADKVTSSSIGELSSLWEKASYCSIQAAKTRAPYDKKVSDLWAEASNNFVQSAETYQKIEEVTALDESDLWTQASRCFKMSGEAFEEAAKAFMNGDEGKGEYFSEQAVSHKEEANITRHFVDKILINNQQIADTVKNSSLKKEWEGLSAKERKKQAQEFLEEAYETEGGANIEYGRLLNTGNGTEAAKTASSQAKLAWSQVAEKLKIGLSLAPKASQEWWTTEISNAEYKATHWANASLSWELPKKEGFYKPSKKDLEQFHYARVVDYELPADFEGAQVGQKKQVRILKTMSLPTYVLIEEIIDTATQTIVNRKAMAADHLSVTLKEGESPEDFRSQLEHQVSQPVITSIRPIIEDKPLYQLDFKSNSFLSPVSIELFKKILALTSELAVRSNPDVLFSLGVDIMPSDPYYHPKYTWPALFQSDKEEKYGQWNLRAETGGIQADKAWAIRTSAENIIVAVIDSGTKASHEDFTHHDGSNNLWYDPSVKQKKSNLEEEEEEEMVYGRNFLLRNNDIEDRCVIVRNNETVSYGHGTPVAGIIGAVGNNGRGIAGIAWKIKMMTCKVAGETTIISANHIIPAIKYACDQGAKIINCSFSFSEGNDDIYNALKYAQDKGVIIVAIAGNDGIDNDNRGDFSYPYDYYLDNVIVVAGSNAANDLMKFSNYGKDTVHLAAPGIGILSTSAYNKKSYDAYSGTSFAAPHVTGALALMMAEFPGKNYKFYIDKLLATTDKIPSLQDKIMSGGRLNLLRALGGEDLTEEIKEKILDSEGSKSDEDLDRLHSYYRINKADPKVDEEQNRNGLADGEEKKGCQATPDDSLTSNQRQNEEKFGFIKIIRRFFNSSGNK